MKKQEQPIRTKVWNETISVYHNGIEVLIAINYRRQIVSLVENTGEKRNYMFCERGLSYEQGWYNVLEAMQVAMKYGFDKLREREEQNEKERTDKLIALTLENGYKGNI